MKQVYFQNGAEYRGADQDKINVIEKLPNGFYSLGQDMAGYFLTKEREMVIEGKVYGNVQEKSDRVLNTYNERTVTTGVLLSGVKGSGKTMLAKRIALDFLKANTDGIIITVAFPARGTSLNTFLQSITQPAVVFFDEFEKVYNRDEQADLLTLFDGTSSTKKLLLITVNDRFSMNTFMLNRPGRIFYHFRYEGLDESFITEYTVDNLVDKAKVESVVNVSKLFREFSFDMLKGIIEEMNRYGESAAKVIETMNIEIERSQPYEVAFYRDGVQLVDYDGQTVWEESSNPLISGRRTWDLYAKDEIKEKTRAARSNEVEEDIKINLDVSLLKSINKDGYEYVFDIAGKPGWEIRYKRPVVHKFDASYYY